MRKRVLVMDIPSPAESKPLASIVVPAYNVGAYIGECIEALLAQTFKNIEIIIIDDGSTDGTTGVAIRYAAVDARIRFVRGANGGVSSARNIAIGMCQGEYILFVDADDVVAADFVETLITLFETTDCECAACGVANFFDDREPAFTSGEVTIYRDSTVQFCMLDKPGGFLCNKAFRASLVFENDLKLREDIAQSEDMLFLLDYFALCNCVAYVDGMKYGYRQRKGSATNALNNRHWFDTVKVFEGYRSRAVGNSLDCAEVAKSFLRISYEGIYRARKIGITDIELQNELEAMVDWCKANCGAMGTSQQMKIGVYKYAMGFVMARRARRLM